MLYFVSLNFMLFFKYFTKLPFDLQKKTQNSTNSEYTDFGNPFLELKSFFCKLEQNLKFYEFGTENSINLLKKTGARCEHF